MSDIFNLADTWNAGGTTFHAIKMNVSNGAGGAPVGAAASRVLNLQQNGVSRFATDITGNLYQRPVGSAKVFSFLGNDVDADTGDFFFNAGVFPGVNLPASARANVVWTFGYNVDPGGGPVDPAEPTLSMNFETYFHQSGTNPQSVLEWHLSSFDTSGVQHRIISAYIPRNGVSGTAVMELLFSTDKITVSKYDGAARILYDHTQSSGNLTLIDHMASAGTTYSFEANNTVVARQKNFAGSSYLNLPNINSRDALAIVENVEIRAPSVNSATNSLLFVQLASGTLATGNSAIQINANAAAAANVDAFFSSISTTGQVSVNHRNLGGGDAIYEAWCATSGGDPWTKYNINSGGIFGIGIDNSDSDAFVISANNGLGTNNRLRIDANTVGFPTLPPKITPVAVGSLPSAATVGAGTSHHVTDALLPTFGATVAAGGAVSTPVYSDGTNWKVG